MGTNGTRKLWLWRQRTPAREGWGKNLSGVGKEIPDVYLPFRFGGNLTILGATNGVGRVKKRDWSFFAFRTHIQGEHEQLLQFWQTINRTIKVAGDTLGWLLCIYLKRMHEVLRLTSTSLRDIHDRIKYGRVLWSVHVHLWHRTANKVFLEK